MHFQKLLFLLLTVAIAHPAALKSQERHTLSGYVRAAETGQQLIGVSVVDLRTRQGALTNAFGFYSLTLTSDSVTIRVSYAGFEPQVRTLRLQSDTPLSFDLQVFTTDVVEIVAENQQSIQEQTTMSTIDVPIEQIRKIPALLGEVDVIKAIQLLPGVQSGSEGATGLYVRGGGPDQNLILLDDVPLYYVSHLGGFFSVFNADAISSVRLIKGGFPARYGGRLSSVLDIRMREGNMQKLQVQGSVGLISSKLSVEGPIIKGKTSFMVSGRRTYLDLLSRPLTAIAIRAGSEGTAKGSTGYYFYDLNFKINHIFNDRNRLYLSTYLGDDRLGLSFKTDETDSLGNYDRSGVKSLTRWGNQLVSLRWNHLWSPRLFSNLALIYTNYRFGVENDITQESKQDQVIERQSSFLGYASGVRDFGLRYDWDFYPNPKHDARFGFHATRHTFNPGILGFSVKDAGTTVIDTALDQRSANTYEFSLYAEDEWKIATGLSANFGLHYDYYLTEKRGYQALQPRASMRYLLNDKVSIKASYASMMQFLHLLSNSSIGLPIDLWVPATGNIPPQRARQTALGIAATPWNNGLEFSLEGYYKHMTGLIEYREGTNFFSSFTNENWQDAVQSGGQGWAYGIEAFIQKKYGKTTGWVGYTLAWNFRQFDQLNGGLKYPYKFDRRHDLSVVVSHRFSDHFTLSGTWVFGTGNALSLATGKYERPIEYFLPNYPALASQFASSNFFFGGSEVDVFDEGRNNFRMEAYHRMDLSFEFTKKKKWGERTWSWGVYNVYARQNPYTYLLEKQYINSNTTGLTRVSLFPFPIPSISYQFKFK